MATDPSDALVQVDGLVSPEKLNQLLALKSEHPQLDFKKTLDLGNRKDLVKLAKTAGAMGVKGGYVIVGADNHGNLTGQLDGADMSLFDEAQLRGKLSRYLPESAPIRSAGIDHHGHQVALICFLPNPRGCSIFKADGNYEEPPGNPLTLFREGDIFWRDGTSSVRISHEGLEEVIERRVAAVKREWMGEQQEIRRQEREEIERNYAARDLGQAPLGTLNFGLAADELSRAALDLIRRGDRIALIDLLNDGLTRARQRVGREEIDDEFGDICDKLACLGATFLYYEQDDWFERVVSIFVSLYETSFDEDDAYRFGVQGVIGRDEPAPRVFVAVMERVFSLGALAVRLQRWNAIRTLTLQLPQPLVSAGYDTNWLRHALTMASRAQQFGQGEEHLGLIGLARSDISRLACLRPDGIGPDDEAVLTSLASFDLLAALVAIQDAETTDRRVFYPNFARYRQDRIQRTADRVVSDEEMREELLPDMSDDRLAEALAAIEHGAAVEGSRYDGFEDFRNTEVGHFIDEHLPPEQRRPSG
jgi:hypothetical protein